MAITRYAQNVATEQIPFQNYPGGGPIPGPSNGQGFNDPGVEIADVREVVAIYQMYGNEASSDIINLYLAQPGTQVKPTGTVSGSGVAATAIIDIGDDDITGFGLVSQTAAPLGADPTRYASGLNVATGQTNPVAFAGGDSLVDPYQIGATAIEPQGASPGAGIAGSWIQARFRSITTPVPGKVLVFRLTILKP